MRMKTTIIKTLAVGRLAILTMAAFLLLAMPGHAEDEAAKNSIREVQQALNGCGFNAGAIDGDYGKRTTQAAAAFVRAHGGNPNTGDKTLLLAQVDFYRAGDAGPCPPEGTEAEATASNESEPAGEAGSVTAEAGSVEADQGEEGKAKTEEESLRQWFETEIIPLNNIYRYIEYTEDHRGKEKQRQRLSISDDQIISTIQREYTSEWPGDEWPDDYEVKVQHPLADMKIEADGIRVAFLRDDGYRKVIYPTTITLRVTCNPGAGECGKIYYDNGGMDTGASSWIALYAPFKTEAEAERMAEILIQKINRLAELKRTGGGNTTGQPVKCYNWVNLGTFNLGRWRNGNGWETSGLPAGSGIKKWDDEELLKDYKAARQHCVSSANGAMDSAVSAMVLIGRQASDVDNEKKRIRSFYKASLDKCQSEFDRRYRKYQNKFCE